VLDVQELPQPLLELGVEAAAGQPAVEHGIDHVSKLAGADHLAGRRDGGDAGRNEAAALRLMRMTLDEVEDLFSQLGRRSCHTCAGSGSAVAVDLLSGNGGHVFAAQMRAVPGYGHPQGGIERPARLPAQHRDCFRRIESKAAALHADAACGRAPGSAVAPEANQRIEYLFNTVRVFRWPGRSSMRRRSLRPLLDSCSASIR
jgi:hypothetical protein